MWENASLEAEIIKVIYKIRNKSERPDEDAISNVTLRTPPQTLHFKTSEQKEDMIKSGRDSGIAAMKAIFMDEIHGLKLEFENFKNSSEENDENLSDEK